MNAEEKPNTGDSLFKKLTQQGGKTAERVWFRALIEFTQLVIKQMSARRINRVQLAKALDVNPSFITRVLKGDTNISVETIGKLSHALNCDFQISLVPRELENEGFVPVEEIQDINGGEGDGAPPLSFFFNVSEISVLKDVFHKFQGRIGYAVMEFAECVFLKPKVSVAPLNA